MLSKLAQIIEGWKGLATNKGFNIQEAQRRAELCAACPFFDESSHTAKALKMPTCSKCGCVIAAKTKSMTSACPIGKWGPYKDENKS